MQVFTYRSGGAWLAVKPSDDRSQLDCVIAQTWARVCIQCDHRFAYSCSHMTSLLHQGNRLHLPPQRVHSHGFHH